MTVYVDDMMRPYGRMKMSHMVADTTEELVQMADRIGVARRHLQCPRTYKEHFDVCMEKRARALDLGARSVTQKELVLIIRARRVASRL